MLDFSVERGLQRLILWTLVGIGLALFGWPGVIAAWVSHLYQDRIMMLGNWEHPARVDLASLYMRERIGEKPVILFIGSSFTFGYNFADGLIFTTKLQRYFPGHRIVNVSTLSAGADFVTGMLCLMQQEGLRVEKVVIEMQLANMRVDLSGPNSSCEGLLYGHTYYRSLYSYFLFNTRGLGDLAALVHEGSVTEERYFQKSPIPPNYFLQYDADLPARLNQTIDPVMQAAKTVADEVYFLSAPVHFPAIDDREAVEKPYLALAEQCGEWGVRCLIPDSEMPAAYFYNYTHLNLRGHEYFARWLADKISGLASSNGESSTVHVGGSRHH